MEGGSKKRRSKVAKGSNRMPADSTFYNKIVPIILIGLAVLTAIIILAAAGIVFGLLPV